MTTLYSDVCSVTPGNIVPPKTNLGVNVAKGVLTVGANILANDVALMVKVPQGAIIIDVAVSASASIAATSTGEVGDGGNTARFIASGAIGSGAASFSRTLAPAGHGYTYPADDTIDIKFTVGTTPATGAVITMTVLYLLN